MYNTPIFGDLLDFAVLNDHVNILHEFSLAVLTRKVMYFILMACR